MNKALMDGLVAKFLESYAAPAKDAIWQQHSATFRRFWSDQVLAKGTGNISDDVCDVVIRILDSSGKGKTKESEAVARTMVPQGVWRKLFNGLHTDQKLASLVDSSLKETNLERKTALIDELYAANEGKKNRLTGESASAINALLAAYDPVKNLTVVSLNHRKIQMDFLQLKLTFDWDRASFGQRIVQSNVLLREGTRALGLDGTARTLSRFWYFSPVMELWKPEDTVKRTDKEEVIGHNSPSQFGNGSSRARRRYISCKKFMTTTETNPNTDNELQFDAELENGEELNLPVNQREVLTRAGDPQVRALNDKQKRGKLVLQPDFQRQYVWDRKKASRLVESVLLRVPLPIIYLSEQPDNKEYVIDGQQRLTSLFSFIDGRFPSGDAFKLTGLTAYKELNKKAFPEIGEELQDRIQDYTLRTVTLLRQSDPDLKFEIFERLNTGSEPLNDMELRNCVYRGSYNGLLKELAAEPDFRSLLGLLAPDRRMRDVELVLRFASFYHETYLAYTSPMKRFYNHDMEKYKDISAEDAAKLRTAFKNALALIRSLLGSQNAFKRYYPGDSKNPNGSWEPKKFNASLFDVLMGVFWDKDKNQVMAALDPLREGWLDIMAANAEFRESIERSTSSQDMVRRRFDLTRLLVEGVLREYRVQPRCFTRELKKVLFEANPTCAICNQGITEVDDAAVDHIEQYWRGGKTIPENARLTHRYCNMARSRND